MESIEAKVTELYAHAQSNRRSYSFTLDNTQGSLDPTPLHDSDRYEQVLATLERHKTLAMREKKVGAGSDEEDGLKSMLGELDRMRLRVLNQMQREASLRISSSRHEQDSPTSQIKLNRTLLEQQKQQQQIPQPIHRVPTYDSGFSEGLSTLHEEPLPMYDSRRSSDSSRPLSIFSDVNFNPSGTRRTSDNEDVIGPRSPFPISIQQHEAVQSPLSAGARHQSRASSVDSLTLVHSHRRHSRQLSSGTISKDIWFPIDNKGWVKM